MKDEAELPPGAGMSKEDCTYEVAISGEPCQHASHVQSECVKQPSKLSRALELFLALPRKLQLAAVATLATVLGSVFGVDTAVLRYLFAPEPVVLEAPSGLPARKCASVALDAERADLEALGK